MKGNDKVIEALNDLLVEELTAISQYMVHAEMCDNWGYQRLHKATEEHAEDEMKHAEKLIGRILFLEGKPVVSKLEAMHIGATVAAQLANDHNAEDVAIKSYNAAINLVSELSDHGTRDMLTGILNDEERHIDWIETQQDQIAQMGLEVYLSNQI